VNIQPEFNPVIDATFGPYAEIDGRTVYMADLLMKPAADEVVIYVNGNPLDNRRANLRIVKKSEVCS
jgi:HNH endonuclease